MSNAVPNPLVFLLLVAFIGSAHAQDDDQAYALMQDCLAGAETSGNLDSQLDRYCIDSYLATRPQ